MLIPLTQNKFAIIDDDDYPLISKYKWHVAKSHVPNIYYARTTIYQNGKSKTLLMHRLISGDRYVDHVNRNGLDNRKINLRTCTISENMANRRKFQNKSSMMKGVRPIGKFYEARITKGKKTYQLGNFLTEKDAALAYDRMAEELFGEFAVLNYPNDINQPKNKRIRSKITQDQAKKIKAMLRASIPIKEIAAKCSTTIRTIYHIKDGTCWKNI